MPWTDSKKQRKYEKQWNIDNRDRRNEINRETKRRLRTWFIDLKKKFSCERCGFSDYRALQFHHKNPAEKYMAVTSMVSRAVGRNRILSEIAKCEVLCANCHQIHHFTASDGRRPVF